MMTLYSIKSRRLQFAHHLIRPESIHPEQSAPEADDLLRKPPTTLAVSRNGEAASNFEDAAYLSQDSSHVGEQVQCATAVHDIEVSG